jgi:hypothetical protein
MERFREDLLKTFGGSGGIFLAPFEVSAQFF